MFSGFLAANNLHTTVTFLSPVDIPLHHSCFAHSSSQVSCVASDDSRPLIMACLLPLIEHAEAVLLG